MAMEQGGERPDDAFDNEQQESEDWYFDLPTGAWERQEEKNRNLRANLLRQAGEPEKPRDPFAGRVPQQAPAPPPKEEKRGGRFGFGRKKREEEEARPSFGQRASDDEAIAAFREPDPSDLDDAWTTEPGWAAAVDAADTGQHLEAARIADYEPPATAWADNAGPVEDEAAGASETGGMLEAMRAWARESQPADDQDDPAGQSGWEAVDAQEAEATEFDHESEPAVFEAEAVEFAAAEAATFEVDPGETAAAFTPFETDEDDIDLADLFEPVVDEVPDAVSAAGAKDGVAAEPVEAVNAPAEEAPRSRWEEAFSAPVDGGILEGMRAWALGSKDGEPVAGNAGPDDEAAIEAEFELPVEADEAVTDAVSEPATEHSLAAAAPSLQAEAAAEREAPEADEAIAFLKEDDFEEPRGAAPRKRGFLSRLFGRGEPNAAAGVEAGESASKNVADAPAAAVSPVIEGAWVAEDEEPTDAAATDEPAAEGSDDSDWVAAVPDDVVAETTLEAVLDASESEDERGWATAMDAWATSDDEAKADATPEVVAFEATEGIGEQAAQPDWASAMRGWASSDDEDEVAATETAPDVVAFEAVDGDAEEAEEPDWASAMRGWASPDEDEAVTAESTPDVAAFEALDSDDEKAEEPDWASAMRGWATSDEDETAIVESAPEVVAFEATEGDAEAAEEPDWASAMRGWASSDDEEDETVTAESTPDVAAFEAVDSDAEEAEEPDWASAMRGWATSDEDEPAIVESTPEVVTFEVTEGDADEAEESDWASAMRGWASSDEEEAAAAKAAPDVAAFEALDSHAEEAEEPDWASAMRGWASSDDDEDETATADSPPEVVAFEVTEGNAEEANEPDWASAMRGLASSDEDEAATAKATPAVVAFEVTEGDAEEAEEPDWASAMGGWATSDEDEAATAKATPEVVAFEVTEGDAEEANEPDWASAMRGWATSDGEDETVTGETVPEIVAFEALDGDVEDAQEPDWASAMGGWASSDEEEAATAKATPEVVAFEATEGDAEEAEEPDWASAMRGWATSDDDDAVATTETAPDAVAFEPTEDGADGDSDTTATWSRALGALASADDSELDAMADFEDSLFGDSMSDAAGIDTEAASDPVEASASGAAFEWAPEAFEDDDEEEAPIEPAQLGFTLEQQGDDAAESTEEPSAWAPEVDDVMETPGIQDEPDAAVEAPVFAAATQDFDEEDPSQLFEDGTDDESMFEAPAENEAPVAAAASADEDAAPDLWAALADEASLAAHEADVSLGSRKVFGMYGREEEPAVADEAFVPQANDDESDLVLRAFEAHAASELEEEEPEPIAEVEDDFGDLFGDEAADIEEEMDTPAGALTFARMQGWAPQRAATYAADDDEDNWEVAREGDNARTPKEPQRPFGMLAPAGFDEEPQLQVSTRGSRNRTLVREIVETGLLAILVFLAVRASFQNFKVDGSSMYPTLEDGQFLIVNKLVYSEVDLEKLNDYLPFIDAGDEPVRHVFHGPERGDIIVLRDPTNPEVDLIKRVVGLPGETIEIVDGAVYINNYRLEEPYITAQWHDNRPAVIIPEDHYFVMGDNRDNSKDSRSSAIGFIPEDLIIGRADLTYWPLGNFGFAPNGDPTVSSDAKPVLTTQRLGE